MADSNETVSLGVSCVGDGLLDTRLVDAQTLELHIAKPGDDPPTILHDVTLADVRRLMSNLRTTVELLTRLHKRGDGGKLLDTLRKKKKHTSPTVS